MSKTKEIIICLIAVISLMLAITTNAFATGMSSNDLIGNSGYSDIEEELAENNVVGNQNAIKNNTINNTINNTANNTNNTANKIPYTGLDNSVIVIIAICGISAVYAYKKIRDYNV